MTPASASPPLRDRLSDELRGLKNDDAMSALADHLAVKGALHGLTADEWVYAVALKHPKLSEHDAEVEKYIATLKEAVRIVGEGGRVSKPTWPPSVPRPKSSTL